MWSCGTWSRLSVSRGVRNPKKEELEGEEVCATELCLLNYVGMYSWPCFSQHTHTHTPPTPFHNSCVSHPNPRLQHSNYPSVNLAELSSFRGLFFFLPFSASISINCARLHRCLTHDDDTQFRSFFFSLQDYISWNTTLHALHSSLGGETLYDIQACYR